MRQMSARSEFRRLHENGCFVIPNPWDIGTARHLRHLGFKALATTSSGFAFSRGLPDTDWAAPRDAMLAHIAEIVAATDLPVNADFESGYAHEPEGWRRTFACASKPACRACRSRIPPATGPSRSTTWRLAWIAPRGARGDRRDRNGSAADRPGRVLPRGPRGSAEGVDPPPGGVRAGPARTCSTRLGRARGRRSPLSGSVAPKPVNILIGALGAHRCGPAGMGAPNQRRLRSRAAWGGFHARGRGDRRARQLRRLCRQQAVRRHQQLLQR